MDKTFEIMRSEAEWRAMLSETEYLVMREEKTERAGSSALDKNYDEGTYQCRGCDLDLYASSTKFDSGTGWPSFLRAFQTRLAPKKTIRFSQHELRRIAAAVVVT